MGDSVIQVEHRDASVYLPELDLWLDPRRAKPRAFISHAHADHVAPHAEPICSVATKRLVEARYRSRRRGEIRAFDFGEVLEERGFRQQLLPAGHILGSAQIHLERIRDGASLLYTGDFKLRVGVASEAAEIKQADTLIMETTFGRPKFRLPPSEVVLDELAGFVSIAIGAGSVPVVSAYSLGKAQEVLIAVGRRLPDLEWVLHPAVARMTEIYEEFGYGTPTWTELKPDADLAGKALIAPPNTLKSLDVKECLTVMVSGWGVDASAKYRYGVDHVFPLSDHAGYDDLIRYVEIAKPKRVLTLHGYAAEFARDLRARGWEAWTIEGEDQLELDFARPTNQA